MGVLRSVLISALLTVSVGASAQQKQVFPLDLKRAFFTGPTYGPAKKTVLTTAEAVEDFEYLKYFLRYGYIGYKLQAKNFNWEQFFALTQGQLKSRPSWPLQEYINVTGKFLDYVEDGHMMYFALPKMQYPRKPFRWHPYVASQTADLNLPQKTSCTLQQRQLLLEQQNVLLSNQIVKASVLVSKQPVSSIQCAGKTIALRELITKKQQLPLYQEAQNGQAYYIRVGTFAKTAIQEMKKFALSAERASKAKYVILDLRGNGGGDPDYLGKWLEGMGLGAPALYWPPIGQMSSLANLITGVNAGTSMVYQLKKQGEDPKIIENYEQSIKESRQRVDALIAQKQFFAQEFRTMKPVSTPASQTRFQGHVLVLVDEECYSACESAAYTSKLTPRFHVVGPNTGGVNSFGDPAPLQLPNSGAYIHIPADILMRLGPDNQIAEGMGIFPQIWTDGNVLENVVNWIK